MTNSLLKIGTLSILMNLAPTLYPTYVYDFPDPV